MSIRRAVAAVLALHCLGPQDAVAQVVTDGSLGPGVALNGPDFEIGEALGTRLGSNLFHSFSDFNVLQGESATFTSNFAGATSNVISRVTGANASIIDGLLRSEIAGADFWLINPNGLVFGANAQLDVPAGFHASTADVLELAGGGEFRATNPGASSLTIAPPSAFGFLDATVGSIAVNGAQLSVGTGETLALVGGAMQLQGASLEALSGRVDLVAVASAGDVAVGAATGAAPAVNGISTFADIGLSGATSVDAGASGAQAGGTVSIVGSDVTISEGSTLYSGTAGVGDAGDVVLDVGTLQLGVQGVISAATTGAGAGGNITILANDPDPGDARPAIEIIDGLITTSTSGSGDAGRITLGSPDAPIDFLWVHDSGFDLPFHEPNALPQGLSVDSTDTGAAAGAGGEITVYANGVQVRDGVGMSASTVDGDGGTIQLHVEDLLLLEFGRITASTTGTGDAGDIRISGLEGATDLLVVGPTQIAWPLEAGIFTSSAAMGADAGAAGSIAIEALDIEVSGGLIGATTEDGAGGSVDLRVDRLRVGEGGIFAGTRGEGDGGQVLVRGMSTTAAALVEMTTGGRISTDSSFVQDLGPTRRAGSAGNLSITATELRLSSDDIVTRVPAIDGRTGDGAGGLITLFVDTLTIDGGVITAFTGGTGDAGTISIAGVDGGPANLVELRSSTSFITTSTNTLTNRIGGDAGSIDIASRNISILAGGILSNTPGSGAGGTIHIDVDNLDLQGEINVGTSGPGNAGNIVIEGIDGAPATSIALSDGAAIRSESALDPNFLWGFLGSAGSISIDASSMTLDGLAVLSVDTASEEGSGELDIGVDTLAVSGGAAISARTSGFGLAGDIDIHGVDGGRATSIELGGEGSRISSASVGSGENAGAAGNISISAGSVTVADGATVTAETVDGEGGTIAMDVGQLVVSNDGFVSTNAQGDGAGGSIVVTADEVLVDGGQVVAQSTDTGPTAGSAGDISIAAGQLRVTDNGSGEGAIDASTADGAGGSIALEVGSMSVAGGGSIQASTSGAGAGGSIAIDATGTVLLEGGQIIAQSTGTGPTAGSAGDISITAAELHVARSAAADAAAAWRLAALAAGEGGIDASTVDGAGGSIAVDVGSLTIGEGGSIQASTTGAGTGGSITIKADGTVLLDAGRLLAESRGTGASGSISIGADELHLQDGGSISVRSTGSGRAGSVFADLGSLFMFGHSQIDATATSSLAGNVELNVSEVAFLQDSIISGLSADPENDGGSFVIQHPAGLVLQRSSILANSASGTGGNISISADAIVLDTESTVEATGQVLTAGEVLGFVQQVEPPVVVDAAAALDTRCTAQQVEERSSMVVHTVPPGAVREPYLPADAAAAPASCRP